MILLKGISQEETREVCRREDISCIGTVSDLEGGQPYDRIQVICYQKSGEQFCGFYHILWDRFVDPSEVANVRVGSASYADGSWISRSEAYQVRTHGSERDHADCLAALKAAATWAQ